MENLDQLLGKVKDQESFLEFAKALQADKEDEDKKEKLKPSLYCRGMNGWENDYIAGFLDSAIAWSEATNFGNRFERSDNLWKKFAGFLYAGKFYE